MSTQTTEPMQKTELNYLQEKSREIRNLLINLLMEEYGATKADMKAMASKKSV